MSACDPGTDSCVAQRSRDYCHRHVSFLLTLALFTATGSLDFQRQLRRSNLHLTFFMKADSSRNSGNLTLLGLAKKSKAGKSRRFSPASRSRTQKRPSAMWHPKLILLYFSDSVVFLIKTKESRPQFCCRCGAINVTFAPSSFEFEILFFQQLPELFLHGESQLFSNKQLQMFIRRVAVWYSYFSILAFSCSSETSTVAAQVRFLL